MIDQIHQKFKRQKGAWSGYVKDHLLPRLFGFELMMAPYAVAHMKLGLQLAETGYDFSSDERLGIYLSPFVQFCIDQNEGTLHNHLAAIWGSSLSAAPHPLCNNLSIACQ